MTELVGVAKQHNLTFLDYHSEASEPFTPIEGARVFSSSLSLGGTFKNIQSFLEVLSNTAQPHLPLHHIEIQAVNDRSTQLKLGFQYIGELTPFLKRSENTQPQGPQSFLILDPWTVDI